MRGAMADLASAIVETMGHPVVLLEQNHTVALANKAFLTFFRVRSEDTLGERLFALGNGQWDIPELRRLLGNLSSGSDRIEDYRVERAFETIGGRSILLNASRIELEGSARILLTINDVTERERAREEVAAGQELSDKLIDSVREGLW